MEYNDWYEQYQRYQQNGQQTPQQTQRPQKPNRDRRGVSVPALIACMLVTALLFKTNKWVQYDN